MSRRTFTVLILILILQSVGFAQPRKRTGFFRGTISGYVFDEVSKIPIEYANIILYRQQDSTQVNGTITNSKGFFKLEKVPGGRFFLEVDFIGYAKKRITGIRVSPRHSEVNVGQIFLTPVAIRGEGVEVEAEGVPISYRIDKKVINVSKQTTSLSGTAVDVLENVPSVEVDIEGNVTLRGSGSFTVLIDGRPSILDPNEILQQIPASSIESIEIITNPSAKYDPDGVAGIINIILKKNKLKGFSGLLHLNAGNKERYGGDFLLSYRTRRFTFNLAADYNRRRRPGQNEMQQNIYREGVTYYSYSGGDADMVMKPYSLRGSVDMNLGHWDVLSLGGRFGSRTLNRGYTLHYQRWSSLDPTRISSTSVFNWARSGDYYDLNLDYQHRWPQKNHKFLARLIFSGTHNSEKANDEMWNQGDSLIDGKISFEEGPATGWLFKTEYSRPLRKSGQLEMGYQFRQRESRTDKQLYDFDPASNDYLYLPLFSYSSQFTRRIQSLYAQFASRLSRLEYQLGFRSEYTFRETSLTEGENYTLDRWDYFPTVHFSFHLKGTYQVMASYTRRINRPRGWWLEPYLNWVDSYNVYRGNPALEPEYVDSYELGNQFLFAKSLLSLDAFYRITSNKVERVRSVYVKDIFLHTFENVGKDYSLGVEFLFNTDLFRWWNINYLGTLYDYRVTGELNGENFNNRKFNWSLRFNNDFRIFRNTRLQLNLRYRSPSVTSQGTREGYFSTDFAFQQQLFRQQLSLTLQVRDVFGTLRREFVSQGAGFYFNRRLEMDTPLISLNIRFVINNYKQKRKQRPQGIEERNVEEDVF